MSPVYIGKFRPDDGLPSYDRSNGRGDAQDFTIKVEYPEASKAQMFLSPMKVIRTSPPIISQETFDAIAKAINRAEGGLAFRGDLPWRGVISGIQIQIHSIID